MPLIWTSNGRIWLALHGPRYAAIQKSFVVDIGRPRSYLATIGNLLMPETDVVLSLENWSAARRCETLEEAQEWAEEKLGVEK
jgi:hypothetical protein